MGQENLQSQSVSKTFCVMPWVGISGDIDGKFRLCCYDDYTKKTGGLGNIEDISIEQYWNQDALREIRKKMLKGEKNLHCAVCYKREGLGAKSARLESNKNYAYHIPSILSQTQSDGYTTVPIFYLDIRFSNICNLACRMCFAGSSTGRIELDKLLGQKAFLKEYSGVWKDSDLFTSDFFLSSLEHVYIAGGEPFLDADQWSFVQTLIDKGVSKNIELEYNTNLTFIPRSLGEIFKKFKTAKVIVSCDGYGEVYEYIRIGAKWSQFTQNLKKMKEIIYAPGVNGMLKTNIVLQRDNIESIPKLYIFFKKIGRVRITINTLVRPKSLSIEYIEPQEKKRLILLYQMYMKKISPEFPEVMKDLSFIIDILQKTDVSEEEQSELQKEYLLENKIIDTYASFK